MSPTSRMIRPGSAGRSELNNH